MNTLLTPEILKRYDVAGPRYTSYPTAPEWSSVLQPGTYDRHLGLVSNSSEPLSLYIHIPFCAKLCTYCGCNVAIRKNIPKYGDEYLDLLEIEIAMVAAKLGVRKSLQQMHWGGGTPTFLSESQLGRLFNMVTRHFDIEAKAEVAIEIEPRTVDMPLVAFLRRLGFNRVSMGVQDFDPKVQESVNRVHSYERILEVYEACRSVGFESINMDLIYGLPFQTLETFYKTIEKIVQLKPNRIAMYSFAHIPWIKKQQNRIDVATLPGPDEKVKIFLEATKGLLKGGYQAIAMDHFALADDEMAIAFREDRLHRNFMGYTVLPGDDFLGLGVSSIGYVQGAYFQNTKDLLEYRHALESGQWPLEKELELSSDDLMRRSVIYDLMCQFKLDRNLWSQKNHQAFEDYFAFEKPHIKNCLEDGLLEERNSLLVVTELGKLFVRNVAMGFDAHLRKEGGHRRFSRVI
jgi:oxygen-independent coproporphyrinogen III oxidase